MSRVIFLGAPGAGKGTQARRLAAGSGVPQVATGDMLREAAAAGTPLGREAKRFMDQGALVPDEVVIGLVDERLSRPDAGAGYVLDGFPRTVARPRPSTCCCGRLGQDLDRVVFLRRLARRAPAPPDRAPGLPAVRDRLPPGFGPAEGAGRLRPVRRRALPAGRRCGGHGGPPARRLPDPDRALLDYYRKRGLLVRVAGEGPVDQVAAAIQKAVKEPVAS